MVDQKGAAIRKRQQIAKASRTMFMWVAGASVIVGASGVLLFVLVQKLIFNERILAEKRNTVNTLEQNINVVAELEDNVRVLNTDKALKDLQTPADSEPVQVIFDALPSKPNAEALGSALVHKDLLGHPSITVESIVLKSPEDGGNESSEETDGGNTLSFTFVVSAKSPEDLRDLLTRMSRSIRSFSITSIIVEGEDPIKMTVEGNAFYQPAKTVDVTTKKVEP